MPNIFEYLDCLQFLEAWIEDKKFQNSRYSKRLLAMQLKCDPSYLHKVLCGKKKIPKSLKLKFIELLKLKKKEQEYFEWLIQFKDSHSHDEKKFYLDKLVRYRRSKIKTTDPDQYELYNKWYYTAVLQLLDFIDFKDEFTALAKCLDPVIRLSEAKKAIEVLEKLNLIQVNGQGFYKKVDAVISTGEGWRSVAITHYQLENLKLAKNAFEKFTERERRFSTLTLSLSEKTIQDILEHVKNFELDCLEQAKRDETPDRIYQINFQAFPISQVHRKGKK